MIANPTRARARVHGRSIELLDDVSLPDGTEVLVTIDVLPEMVEPGPIEFATWDIALTAPLTREAMYDDD